MQSKTNLIIAPEYPLNSILTLQLNLVTIL